MTKHEKAAQHTDAAKVPDESLLATAIYTVSYHANGGIGAPLAQQKMHDIPLKLSLDQPLGRVFRGWAIHKNGEVVYQPGDTYTLNESVTLYAAWSEMVQHTVKYDANGGVGAPPIQQKFHHMPLEISSVQPIYQGHVFQGWATDDDEIVVYRPGDYYVLNESVTLYAVWSQGGGPC